MMVTAMVLVRVTLVALYAALLALAAPTADALTIVGGVDGAPAATCERQAGGAARVVHT